MATELLAPQASRPRARIEPRPEFAGILRNEETFATGASDGVSERVNGWFDRLLLQSGLDLSPTVLLLLSVCAALAAGGAAFVIQEQPLSAALGALLGSAVPIVATVVLRARRQTRLLKQMPGLVDELARAARTGRSLEQCLDVVARDTPEPLGDELRRCTRKLKLGVRLDAALRELPLRTGLVGMHVLVTALVVHRQSGGDLVQVLERLSRTVRDRIAYLGRLRTATAANRATAVLMLVLPPLILAFYVFRDGDYLDKLLGTAWGRTTFFGAIGLQVVGSFFVARILRNSRRT
jgi:tight adherence protein B